MTDQLELPIVPSRVCVDCGAVDPSVPGQPLNRPGGWWMWLDREGREQEARCPQCAERFWK